ncbi:MAG: ABC transporter substrate-binding protein, partial [Clostridia bacterium]|nr:ABC transporter substrate-binding protein [Clostridia bacterium]
IYTYLGGSGDAPKVFGQMTNCDGSFLVGRKAEPDFKWSNLNGKDVLAGRPGGVPFMTFNYICKEQNVKANFITDVQFDSMTAAFTNGVGDYVTMFEPSASEFQKSGKGYIVAPVGPAGGEVPYTCFMAKQSFIEKETGKVDAILRSVTKATKYIYEHDTATVADKIAKYFDNTSKESITVSLDNYKSINTWVTNMAMTESRFTRLQDIIQDAGELEKRVNFTDIVLTQRADEIYQEVYA